ncbi:MAG: aldehyde dehydrogenase family protein [Candidatus Omnitrophota bacterium]|jgi:acyl-CoA reductase-like NAD-dependent aldehyde dehydrogenase
MKQKIINPGTGETVSEVDIFQAQDIEAAIVAARKSFDNGAWRNLLLPKRKKVLLKIAEGILEQAQQLAKLETLNTGKPIKETTFMDIPSASRSFGYIAENFEDFLKEETINAENAKSHLVREPIGAVVLIIPWNYPLLIASWKLASALAAGNSVILKPSSLTPLTALELEKIAQRAGLPDGVLKVVVAKGSEAGEALCSDKRVDMISFTGSNAAGKDIVTYAAKNVKKLIMELGGKSASIILKDADLELAVNGSLCSIFLNQGQMCTAMSRIFIADEVYDKFTADFVEKAKRIKLGDGLNYETQMGPLISREQRKKVVAFIEKATIEGAKILCGGKIPDDPELKGGFFFEPTVLTQVKPGMQIFQEEVFGPVVCLSRFSRLEEAVNLANATDFALAACIWSQDSAKAKELAKEINAGTVWINTYGMFYNEVPYGGFKESGFGKELGKEGFLEYTRLKNIFLDQAKDAKPLVNYWYGL